ncbi:C2 domain-containing protein [Aureococcus anophagefferens]|nr:C2 domain-containing protein [Aureococcus anophagefferens]
MTTKEVVEFVASEARKDHEDNVYEDYLSDEAKKRFKLAVVMGPAYQQRLRIGKLKVKLIEAANLPAADLGGKSDPYARLIITGKNKYGNEWTEEKRQTWQSATVKKSLNPGWHEQCEFFVPRYDAVLRVEIYDLDVSSADDLLGSVEIPIRDLSFLGLVKRWVPLEIAEGFTAASAAVHLHLEYEEMKPYLDVATAAEKIVTWKDERKSRTWLAICLFVAFFIEYFWEMLHLAIVALVHNYFEKKLDVIRAEAAACFQRIDADGGGSLDRSEIGLAMAELATKNARPPPPDDEIDALFKKADEDGGGELDLDEFTQLCIDSPSIMGFDKAEEEAEEEVDDEPEDPEAAALLAGAAGGEKKKRSLSFRKPKDDGDRKEDHKGPSRGHGQDVAEVRDLFEWKEPKKTLPILAGNVFMVLFHYVTPLWMFFVPAVCGAFFVLTEKLKALERVAAKGAKARSRYVELRKLKLGTGDRGAISVLAHPTDRPVLAELSRSTLPGFGKSHNKRLIKTVVTGIFSRLDEDGSGSVGGKELTDFIVGAMPNASPRAQAMFGGCPTAVARVVERLVAKFDVNGDGEIDKAEFTEIVRKTGCVERAEPRDGAHALPAPDKPEPNGGGYLVHDLAYAKRKGDKVSVTGITKVEPDAAKLNRVAVHAPGSRSRCSSR